MPDGSIDAGSLVRIGGVNDAETALPRDPATPGDPVKPLGHDLVTKAFAPGALVYTTGTAQIVAPQTYLRLGTATPYEAWLQTDKNISDGSHTNPGPDQPDPTAFPSPGMLLHTTGTLALHAPNLVQTSDKTTISTKDAASVSRTSNGRLTSVTRTWTELLAQTKVSLALGDNYNAQLGNTINTTIGSAATYFTGEFTTYGVGFRLNGNAGLTSNVFTGPVVNMNNGTVELLGFEKAYRLSDSTTYAPSALTFGIAATPGIADSLKNIQTSARAIGVAAAVITGALNAAAIMVPAIGATNETSPEAIRALTYKQQAIMRGLEGAMLVLQIMTCISAKFIQLRASAVAETSSSIKLTNGAITLSAGGTEVRIDGGGFRVDSGNLAKISQAKAIMTAINLNGFAANTVSQYLYNLLLTNPDLDNEHITLAMNNRLNQDVYDFRSAAPPTVSLKAPKVLFETLEFNAQAAL